MKSIFLFPLPSSIFFPTTPLPLHIFEPRYRQMISDALEADRWIGMVLLKPGWEENYYGKPAVEEIGCAGSIESWKRHEDGKYDIVLRGQSRFRIVQEIGETPYRQAEVELLSSTRDQALSPENPLFKEVMTRYGRYVDQLPEKNAQKVLPDLSECQTLGEALDRLAYLFDLPFEHRREFLTELDVPRRQEKMISLLDLKLDILKRSLSQKDSNIDFRLN